MNEKTSNPFEALRVGPDDEGLRLDVFCSSHLESCSRNQFQKLNREGRVAVDGVLRPDHYRVCAGETVRVEFPAPASDAKPLPQQIDLPVTYEDDHIIVVNKPAGMVVHPAYGNREGTVVNAVLGRGTPLAALGGTDRPGIVHRLDKDTSGLLMIAKSDTAYKNLAAQIKSREIEKVYHAIVWGSIGMPHRSIDAPIARHPVNRQKMAVARRGGREALTEVFVVDTFEYFDYIRLVPVTGRTHQLRVHLSHISHPILGDSVYGGRKPKSLPSTARVRSRIAAIQKAMPRQALTASKLVIKHPVTGERLVFKTALPEDMRNALELLHRNT